MSHEKPQELGDEYFSKEESQSESFEELESKAELEEDESGEKEVKFQFQNVREETQLSSSIKRFKKNSIDRLSALPDCLLFHILSFLLTREAAITCVLSKKWRFLWTELPSLEFINSDRFTYRHVVVEDARMFFSMVRSALATRTGNNLERLVVNSYYDKSLASEVDVLLEFVVKKMGKEVALSLAYMGAYYTLPEIVYSNSLFTRLNLLGCIFNSQIPIMWPSLTTLTLGNVKIHEHAIGKVLSGCPILDTLILRGAWGFNSLEIDSPSIHTLEFHDWRGTYGPLIEISAPYIKSLHVFGRKLRIRNICSVLTTELDFKEFDWDSSLLQLRSYMPDLFVGLQHVKTLHLGKESITIISKLAVTGWQFPQSRRERLIVEARRDEGSISSIVALLESSPSLETLDIRGYIDYRRRPVLWRSERQRSSASFSIELMEAEEPTKWHPPARVDLNCDLLRLKTVNIIDFAFLKLAGEPMLTLAQILLKRATVLEKMVIKEEKSPSGQASSYLKISQTLLGLPRSSQKAVVRFG